MYHEFFSESSHKPLFTVFDSVKSRKMNMFSVHHHAELEIGYVCAGEGDYVIGEQSYRAKPGDVFLIGVNEQHCIPTVYTPEFALFNIRITSNYLWTICSDYIEPRILNLLIGGIPVTRRFSEKGMLVETIRPLLDTPEENRFRIRRALLDLMRSIADELAPTETDASEKAGSPLHVEEIQNILQYIDQNIANPITLDDIVRQTTLSRSYLTDRFRNITGVTPYEYLILRRIERAVTILRETNTPVLEVAYECGFRSQTNFNKTFKKKIGMSPRDYREMKKTIK